MGQHKIQTDRGELNEELRHKMKQEDSKIYKITKIKM